MKKKHHMSKFVIIFVILSIFSFTALAIWLQFATSVELSATLITCFYGFCCSELWMLASIKKQKIKHNFVDDPNTPENEAEIYSQIYNQGREEALNMVRDILNGNHNNDKGEI